MPWRASSASGRWLRLGLACGVWATAIPTSGAVTLYRCTDDQNRTTVRSEPCQSGERDARPDAGHEAIPLLERGTRGQYWIPALANGQLQIEFLIDTGANIVVLPQDRIDQLVAQGSLTDKDWLGNSTTRMGDGTLVRYPMARLDSLRIGSHVIRNIAVNVIPANGLPLLGTPVLEQLGAWRIDQPSRQLILPRAPREPATRNAMRQCWRADGITYLSASPCPAGEEAASPTARTASTTANCRTRQQTIRRKTTLPLTTREAATLREQIDDYNKECPGLVYQDASGRSEILRRLVLQPRESTPP
ncbi:MAG: clan AA aspartic protease [Magnetococcales bacterium]|nr:clan AA aspartic protease [Magnetococcales bacterium]